MKNSKFLAGATMLMLALATGAAQASQPTGTIWDWSYAAGGVSASGQWETLGNATTPEALQWITGTYSDANITNGQIDGLVPLGTDGAWYYDNAFGGPSGLSNPGVLFDVAGGAVHVNLYTENGGFVSGTNWNGAGYAIATAQFQVSPVPEPTTLALLMAGLGALGLAAQRKRIL